MTEQYGTDALRLSLIVGQSAGQDFRMYEEKIAGQRNFINKLWNIGRYVAASAQQAAIGSRQLKAGGRKPASLADRWILSRLADVTKAATTKIESFDFSAAGQVITDFVWHDFADWYVEIHKLEKNDAILRSVFDDILRLLHPFAPFVTEALWQEHSRKLLMIESWPTAGKRDAAAEKTFAELQRTVVALRNFKKYGGLTTEDHGIIRTNVPMTTRILLERLSGISFLGQQPGRVVTLGLLKVEFPAERVRAFEDWRKKERANLEAYTAKLEQQLKNPRLPETVRAELEQKKTEADRRRSEL